MIKYIIAIMVIIALWSMLALFEKPAYKPEMYQASKKEKMIEKTNKPKSTGYLPIKGHPAIEQLEQLNEEWGKLL